MLLKCIWSAWLFGIYGVTLNRSNQIRDGHQLRLTAECSCCLSIIFAKSFQLYSCDVSFSPFHHKKNELLQWHIATKACWIFEYLKISSKTSCQANIKSLVQHKWNNSTKYTKWLKLRVAVVADIHFQTFYFNFTFEQSCFLMITYFFMITS